MANIINRCENIGVAARQLNAIGVNRIQQMAIENG